MIWYNIAVVESKKGHPGPALEHLRRLKVWDSPGIWGTRPNNLMRTPPTPPRRIRRKRHFQLRSLELQKEINEGAHLGSTSWCAGTPTVGGNYSYNLMLKGESGSSVVLKIQLDHIYYDSGGSEVIYEEATLDLADFMPDVTVKEVESEYCNPKEYDVMIKTVSSKSFHLSRNDSIIEGKTGRRVDTPYQGDETQLDILFPRRDLAAAAAKTLSEAIRMRTEIN